MGTAYTKAKRSLVNQIRREGASFTARGRTYTGIIDKFPTQRELKKGGWHEDVAVEIIVDLDQLSRGSADNLRNHDFEILTDEFEGKLLFLQDIQSDEVAVHLGLVAHNRKQPSRPF